MNPTSGISAESASGGDAKQQHSLLNSAAAEPLLQQPTASGTSASQMEEDVPMTFPQKLMEMLDEESNNDSITWLPHGRGFIIYKKKKLAAEILPRYFKQSKFTSFTRKLNRWGFTRITRGHEMGAYYHKLFQRGETRLCLQMSCQSGTKVSQDNKDPQQFLFGGDMTQQNQHLIRQQLQQLQLQQMHLQQLQLQQQQQLQAAEFFRQAMVNNNGGNANPSEKSTSDDAAADPTTADNATKAAATAVPPQPFDFQSNLLLQSLQRTKDSAAFAATMPPGAATAGTTTTPPMMGLMPTPMLSTPADFAAHIQAMSAMPPGASVPTDMTSTAAGETDAAAPQSADSNPESTTYTGAV